MRYEIEEAKNLWRFMRTKQFDRTTLAVVVALVVVAVLLAAKSPVGWLTEWLEERESGGELWNIDRGGVDERHV